MSHVTIPQLSDWMNVDFTPEQRIRAAQLITVAERYVTRRAGWDFFKPETPNDIQSLDWVEVVCRVAQKMIRLDDPATRNHVDGPYQSERNADYQYTLKTVGTDLNDDPEITRIIDYWQGGTPDPISFATEGPTKNKTTEYDPDIGTWYDITDALDISRYSVPFSED